MASSARSFTASVVGWLIVGILVVVLFSGLLGFIAFLVRAALFVVVIGVLLTLYFRLRDG